MNQSKKLFLINKMFHPPKTNFSSNSNSNYFPECCASVCIFGAIFMIIATVQTNCVKTVDCRIVETYYEHTPYKAMVQLNPFENATMTKNSDHNLFLVSVGDNKRSLFPNGSMQFCYDSRQCDFNDASTDKVSLQKRHKEDLPYWKFGLAFLIIGATCICMYCILVACAMFQSSSKNSYVQMQ